MATAKQRAKGVWGIQIKVRGIRESATFPTKREAELWAHSRRLELEKQTTGRAGEVFTLGDAIERYSREVSPTHKGQRWEQIRLIALARQLPVTLLLDDLKPEHFSAWKKQRLEQVSAGTVNREMALISSVLNHAWREWRWMKAAPMTEVSSAPKPRHRERVIHWTEARRMMRQLGYSPRQRPASLNAICGAAFWLALHTGMRAGEIVGMRWEHLHANWVRLPDTKNGTARDVPLSARALRIIDSLRGLDTQRIVPIASGTLDAFFRRARERAGLQGFTFHDSRHTAATRIGRSVGQAGKLSFPEFCKVFGWRDPKYALVYVNPKATDLALKL